MSAFAVTAAASITWLLIGPAMGQTAPPSTLEDFHLPGTQIGDVTTDSIFMSADCSYCHSSATTAVGGVDPYGSWVGSLMANAGRDPLFFAQMTTANQDVPNAGYYCMRCHVPTSFVSGHAIPADGTALDEYDADGVNCHFCHSMVDPIARPGAPAADAAVLAGLEAIPQFYGNAMFVLDPTGLRRGPYNPQYAAHPAVQSDFHSSGDMCGTCHDVGNVCTTKLPDGSFTYNEFDAPPSDTDPHSQFPLERTYTEWKLSAFANGGVDMGGRFGGDGLAVVSSCQDCHMPQATGQGCLWGPERTDLKRHDFAGASAWVLEIIGKYYETDPSVNQDALLAGRAAAEDMLTRAASMELTQSCGVLNVRVINESGHKIPTGHIEGRRIWANVKFLDADGAVVQEFGHYDQAEAHLDESTTDIYEMHVGLSPAAAAATGYPAGTTTHMALADTIMKDNRIPPRGFDNAVFEAAGAPAVGCVYDDGQHWDDTRFVIPEGTARVLVTLNYQTVTRHYIEALHAGNHTNHWGQTLFDLWEQTNKGAPIPMVVAALDLQPAAFADLDCSGDVGGGDLAVLLASWGPAAGDFGADINGDGTVDGSDLALILSRW